MALPSSGTIKMSQVRDELKKTGMISLGNADVRKLGGKPSGTIKMSDLYGKSTEIVYVKIDSFSNSVHTPTPPNIMVPSLITDELKKRNIPISFTPEEAQNIRKGNVYYSKDKVYKIIIVDVTGGVISSGIYMSGCTVDIYKAQ